jgi:hypothetical protein
MSILSFFGSISVVVPIDGLLDKKSVITSFYISGQLIVPHDILIENEGQITIRSNSQDLLPQTNFGFPDFEYDP